VLENETVGLPSPDDLDLGRGYLAYIHDTSAFGFTGPVVGTRYRLEVGATGGSLQYQTALADFRRYVLFEPASFAVRAMHYGRYGSGASDPLLADLFLGRETLVRGYSEDSFSAAECTAGAGSTCPEFDRLIGDRLAVVNLELRLQALGTADFGLARAPLFPLELAAFLDIGAAWDEDNPVELDFDRDSIERVPVASVGLTARTLLVGYLPLEFFAAYPLHRPEEDLVYGFLIRPGW
jgi:outer membrane protein assembly factor BamA